MSIPILTSELAELIETADYKVMRDRMLAIAGREGNPYGVELRLFGSRTAALRARDLPPDFNKIWLWNPSDLDRMDDILSYYREVNSHVAVDLIPSLTSEEMMRALHRLGFSQIGFHTAMYGVPLGDSDGFPAGVTVRVAEAGDDAIFASLFHRSLELPADIAENAESFSRLLLHPDWKLYIGYAEEEAAAFAMLRISLEGVACFGMAGTLPAYRGRGLQTALLRKRMEDASRSGCRLVAAQTEYGTTSFRNLQKAGLRVAYTKAIWQHGFDM
ncbi:GNAT family N-acetyltransferase [Paenibacillus gansuensis]|uniref:GNAT family N-acetyltransferase n=1 Tax=Paenibacillus gansuensis TaxID=306542 RepID=A0ABW5PHR0_9BACL